MKKGTIYLIPAPISEDAELNSVLPEYIFNIINDINYFIVENVRTARRFLRKYGIKKSIENIYFYQFDKHAKHADYSAFIRPAISGNDMAVMSEAGLPGIADPGAVIVDLAHKEGITIKPLVGPSSLFLALMASGLNGQNFAFNGYLPIKQNDRYRAIRKYESESVANNHRAQIFIETPYRNNKIIDDFLRVCRDSTLLCIATDLTGKKEFIKTKTIKEWKQNKPVAEKIPAIFIIQA